MTVQSDPLCWCDCAVVSINHLVCEMAVKYWPASAANHRSSHWCLHEVQSSREPGPKAIWALSWVKRRDPVCRSAQCLCQNFIVKWTGIYLTQIVRIGLDNCRGYFPCLIHPLQGALKIWQYLTCKWFTVRQQAMPAYRQYTNVAYLSSCPF